MKGGGSVVPSSTTGSSSFYSSSFEDIGPWEPRAGLEADGLDVLSLEPGLALVFYSSAAANSAAFFSSSA